VLLRRILPGPLLTRLGQPFRVLRGSFGAGHVPHAAFAGGGGEVGGDTARREIGVGHRPDPQPDGAEHRRPDDERDPAGGTLLVSGVVVAADVRRGGVPAVLGRSYGVGDRVPEAVPGRRPRLPEVLGVADVEMAAEIAGPLDGARGHIASLEPHALTEVAGA